MVRERRAQIAVVCFFRTNGPAREVKHLVAIRSGRVINRSATENATVTAVKRGADVTTALFSFCAILGYVLLFSYTLWMHSLM